MHEISEAVTALKFGGAMVVPLLALAVVMLAIVLDKAFVFWRYARVTADVRELIETYGFSWLDLEQKLLKLRPGNYYRRFIRVILDNRQKPSWWAESRAADEAQLIEKAAGRALWALETTVTAAPLLGLLGTIIGMMNSFKLISGNNLVDPTGVTGGVAQALIATALGLLVALIALFAFNFFSQLQARALDEMERLGTRLLDHIRLDEEETREAHREAA